MLMAEPHFLSAWLSQHQRDFALQGNGVLWTRNPLDVLAETYHLLHLDDPAPRKSPPGCVEARPASSRLPHGRRAPQALSP